MNLSNVDCMTCLVNVARGLKVEHWRIQGNGVTHAVVYDMGPGRAVAACWYERYNLYGCHIGWRRRKNQP